jgi:flavin reductase (DIM6/NTAB) family NADH-FMN oxidoreductase RutF
MGVSPDEMRESMRLWTTGVAIFSAQFEGLRHGMTVSSFTSISLEPPLVLASIQKDTRTHELMQKSGAFGVTILSQDQIELSDRFAGRLGEEAERFVNVDTETLITGSPLITGGLAYFDCQIVNHVDLPTHSVFIGEVIATRNGVVGGPLAYFDRAYRKLQE